MVIGAIDQFVFGGTLKQWFSNKSKYMRSSQWTQLGF